MYLQIQERIREKYQAAAKSLFGLEVSGPAFDLPPRPELGDLSIAACFELAKKLKQPPRNIAGQLAEHILPVEGVERISVAGAGYLNFHLDRATLAAAIFQLRNFPAPSGPAHPGKVLVEHTSINPNKAAHIGHLRNAVLGDTFVRLLRFRGHRVEIENYIDNTGVQVADVVVGFRYLEKKSLEEIEWLINNAGTRFDYYCWDLYARVSQFYQTSEKGMALRAETLKAIEEGRDETARMAKLISTAIVRLHLETMRRINVQYDLLVEESEILRLDFWKAAFERMKRIGAIRYETAGKNTGCWVMDLGTPGAGPAEEEWGTEDVKIIVRSNGTVTYVGKDIAYHMWKFALLGKDFLYAPFYRYPDAREVWHTSTESVSGAPEFGRATAAYAVIDSRQAYLQNIVAAAFRALGFQKEAENLHHFAYEVVGLSPACAREMGFELSPEALERSYVEVSGRKGLGLKADDLIDMLSQKAHEEVRAREMTKDAGEQTAYSRMIAVGALRYFLLKFSCHVIITFDFKEALAFEGETGPYLQYTVVRARNIFRKYGEANPGFKSESLAERVELSEIAAFFAGADGTSLWEMAVLAAQLEMVADQAISTTEPAALSKYAFRLAQAFNNFYHRFHILSESDPARQAFLLYLVHIIERTLTQTLDLLGIEVPERM
ncbi:MAG TPA: arginine--tRNA ligase [Terriglobia bacterium]|nr:arginine--tRNA ligase [Terriglobia bacterium]